MPPRTDPERSAPGMLRDARGLIERAVPLVIAALTTLITALAFLGCLAASAFQTSHLGRAGIAAAIAFVLGFPTCALISLVMRRLVREANAASDDQQHRIDLAGRHREFEATLADALEMADTEPEALRVIERSFATVLPTQPVELLLADNSHAHLSRMAFTAPDGSPPGCGVASPQECPAARRARIHHFPDSAALNACPKLEGRPIGRCSALCIPVAVMGRTVGVIHTVGDPDAGPPPDSTTDLRSVANQAGTRLGMLRVMAETQLQASTDALPGLLNRRAFENNYLRMRPDTRICTVAMADLDHFKDLNDTYGHDTGDRALRTFAEALRSSLRAEDLISRRGGEEFAIFFPNSSADTAVAALQRLQEQLRTSLHAANLPTCTASFGIVEAGPDEALDTMLTRADTALFAAKQAGRNRLIVHDHTGHEKLYPATAFPDETREQPPHAVPTE